MKKIAIVTKNVPNQIFERLYYLNSTLDTNRDTIPDDLICVFAKENCNFGFASHLFGNEIRSLGNGESHPRGATFR